MERISTSDMTLVLVFCRSSVVAPKVETTSRESSFTARTAPDLSFLALYTLPNAPFPMMSRTVYPFTHRFRCEP